MRATQLHWPASATASQPTYTAPTISAQITATNTPRTSHVWKLVAPHDELAVYLKPKQQLPLQKGSCTRKRALHSPAAASAKTAVGAACLRLHGRATSSEGRGDADACFSSSSDFQQRDCSGGAFDGNPSARPKCWLPVTRVVLQSRVKQQTGAAPGKPISQERPTIRVSDLLRVIITVRCRVYVLVSNVLTSNVFGSPAAQLMRLPG